MRFTQPLWLALPLLAAALALAAKTLRRRRGGAVRFAGTALLAEMVQAAPRHRATKVLGALAVIAVAFAFSEPTLPVVESTKRANVILVVDVSGSMTADDVAPTRLTAAKAAGVEFIENLPEGWKVGIVSFSDTPAVIVAPTDDTAVAAANLQTLAARGGTATGDALNLAIDTGRAGGPERLSEALEKGDDLADPSRSVVVLLSDGKQTAGENTTDAAALRAQRLGVPIFTIAFGTDAGEIEVMYPDGTLRAISVAPDLDTSRRIAELSGGAFFTAVSGEQLAEVYRSVRAVLEKERQERDISNPFAYAAALSAAAAVLWWAKRGATP